MRRLGPALSAAAAVVLGVLAATVLLDLRASHGLLATYRYEAEGRSHRVARTVEHRIAYPNEHRALARYVQHWDFERFGIPEDLPPLDVALEATLTVPEGRPLVVRAQSPNEVSILVDGEEAGEAPVLPGDHELVVFWKGSFRERVGLTLQWGGEGGYRAVPWDALRPAGGELDPLRLTLWIGGALLALLLGGLALGAVGARTRARRRRVGAALATLVVVLLGLGYRVWDYDVMPEFRENPDELFAEWNGWSLLTDGTTQGWSLWAEAYGDLVTVEHFSYFRERPVRIIRPYFEHPPLMHLLVGAVAKLSGASHWAHARLMYTRLVPILLGVFCVWLVVRIGRRLYPRGPAPWLGALLYATLPMIALQGRVIKEEALVAPLALLGVLFYLRHRDDGGRMRDVVVAALCCGLCTLAKMPGVVFVPILVFLLFLRGEPRAAWLAAAIGLGVSALVLVYGAALDWDAFWFTTIRQASGRPAHFNLFPRFFDDPLVNHNLIGRGYLLFLWLAWALALRRGKGEGADAALAVPPVIYVLGIGLTSGNWTFGWYMMPVYPFLCLGAGRYLADLFERPDLVRASLFVVLVVLYALNFTVDPDWALMPSSWPTLRHDVTLALVGLLAPFALAQAFRLPPLRTLARLSLAVGLAMVVVLSGIFVVRYDEFYETYQNFDRNRHFDR